MRSTPRATLEERIAAAFARSQGLIDRDQAMTLGMTRHQIDARVTKGQWVRVYRGVYRLAAVAPTPLSDLHAAVLAAGEGAVVSHLSAAWLHRMFDQAPTVPTVTVPRSRNVRVNGIRVVRTRRPIHTVRLQGLACTSPIRALVECSADGDPDLVDLLVDQTISRRILRDRILEKAAWDPGLAYHRGQALLQQRLLARGIAGSPNPSVLESRMARVFKKYKLPVPKAEVIWGSDQEYRIDFAYPQLKLAIEVDGWATHSMIDRRRSDKWRENALRRKGWTVLRYDWWMVTYQAEKVAQEIAETYAELAQAA